MTFSRWLKRNKKVSEIPDDEITQELKLNPFINRIFESVLKIDEFLIRLGVKLPFGGSLMVVTTKN